MSNPPISGPGGPSSILRRVPLAGRRTGARRADGSRRGLPRWAQRLVALLGFVIVWWAFAALNAAAGWFNPILLPSPAEVAGAGVELQRQGELIADIRVSLLRALAGFALGAAGGVLLGAVAGYLRVFERVLEPVVELLRPIPPLAFLPVFIIWFGIGETSKVLFIAYSVFFPVFLNTYSGVRYVDPVLMRAAQSLGARRGQILRTIVIPHSMPPILTGLRMGAGMALFVLVAAELIVAQQGIGYRIQSARQLFQVDLMLFGAFLIGVLGLAFNAVLLAAERRVLRWKSSIDQVR